MKVLASFPQLVARGGSERVLEVMAKNLDLTIVTNKYDQEKTFDIFKKTNIIELKKLNKFFYGMKLARTKFKGYDIFHSHGYFINNFLSIQNHPTIFYCITPKRDIYKLRKFYLNKINNPIKKTIYNTYLNKLKMIDQYLVKNKIDGIISISEEVRRDVNASYGRDCNIIYPPTKIEKYKYKETRNYYLCVSRMDPVKRIDIIVEAFNKMPDKRLVIVGSVTDKKYFNHLKNIAKKNTTIKTNISEKEIIDLYSKCISTIYIPILEDFGIVPVESMASGKPCIGANEGGLKETIIHGKTGLLIEPTIENIIKSINELTPERAESMKNNCIERAKDFSEKKFINELKKLYKSYL
jgi:glycosyltransferase involved in cell wall biosynthesis